MHSLLQSCGDAVLLCVLASSQLTQIHAAGPQKPASLAESLDRLKSKDPAVRRSAVQAIGALGPTAKDATPVLLNLLRSSELLFEIQDAFAKIGEAAVPALTDAWRTGDRAVQDCVVLALRGMGPKAQSMATLLADRLKTDKGFIVALVQVLGKMGPGAKDAVPVLAERLEKAGPREDHVRVQVMKARGPNGPDAKAVAPLMVRQLKFLPTSAPFNAPPPQSEGMASIARLGAGVAAGIAELLEDSDPEVRRSAIMVLGTMGPAAKDAIPALRAELQAKDKETRTGAA